MSQQQLAQTARHNAPHLSVVNGAWLQRKCACGSYGVGSCDKCRMHDSQQDTSGSSLPPIVEDVLSSPGQPLDSEARDRMESQFGHDFSHVRVQTDGRAGESARAVNADAYTVGNNVVFGAGQYAPQEFRGQRLIAHELTHVLQQSGSSPGPLIRFGEPDSAAEREADQISGDIMQGQTLVRDPEQQSVSLQRQPTGASTSQPASPPTSQPSPPAAQAISTAANLRGPGGFGNFDAQLDRNAALNPQRRTANEPCRLVLSVRVRLNFTDDQTPSRWTPAEQNRWTSDYVRVVTDRWSFRFLLQPRAACGSEPCRLATAILHVEPVTSNPHHTINVLYDRPPSGRGSMTELYRSSVERPSRDLRTGHALATHETGHLLGLEHVHCNTNDDQCYGTNREESADVMGRGEIVTERDYESFVMALNQLSGCNWQVRDGARGPLFSQYALGLGVTLGAIGAVLGGFGGYAIGGGAGAFALGFVGGVVGGAIGGLIGSALEG